MRRFGVVLTLMILMSFVGVASADIIITEIIQNPGVVGDNDGEWIELYNSGASTVDINGWTVSDNGSDSFVIDNGGALNIVAEGFLILGKNGDTSTNGNVTVDYVYPAEFYLSNGDDEVILTDASSTEMDRVEYDGGTNFPDPNGASMYLTDPTADNNVGGNWATSTEAWAGSAGDFGSPGAENPGWGPVPTATFTIADGTFNPGVDDVNPDIIVTGFTNVTNFDILVTYDESVYNVTSVAMNENITGTVFNWEYSSEVQMTWSGTAVTLDPASVFANLVGTVAGSVNDQTVFNMSGTMTNSDGASFDITFNNATWTILPAPANVIITEIMQNPGAVSDDFGEYFEIYNAGGESVDLNGWTVQEADGSPSFVIGSSVVVAAGAYAVLGRSIDTAINGNVTVDYAYDGTWALGNSSDSVVLLDGDSQEIDRVEYDNGATFPDPSGASMFLIDMTADNNVGSAWSTSTEVWSGSAGDAGSPGEYNQMYLSNSPKNAGFEDWTWRGTSSAPDFWMSDKINDASYIFMDETTFFVEGSAALFVGFDNFVGTNFIYQNLAINPDLEYTFEAYIDDEEAHVQADLKVELYDASDLLLDTFTSTPGAGTGYVNESLVLTAPLNANAVYAKVGIEVANEAGGESNFVFIDDVNWTYVQPIVDIETLQLNAETLIGTEVYTGGIITVPFGVLADYNTQAYIQDATGYGIALYDSGVDILAGYSAGDEITVLGTLGDSNGKTRITDFTVALLSSGNEVPAPMVFSSTYNFENGGAYEGNLATVSGIVLDPPEASGSYSLDLNDGSGTTTVRIQSGTGVDMSAVSLGSTVTFSGVFNYYYGCQITPLYQTDIVVDAEPIEEPTNWDFETWVTGTAPFDFPSAWYIDSYPNLTLVQETATEYVVDGTSSVKATLSAEEANYIAQDLYGITAGHIYLMGIQALDNDASGYCQVTCSFRDANGDDIAEGTFTSDPTTDSAEWQDVVVGGLAPEGVDHLHLEIELVNDTGWDGDFVAYFDAADGQDYTPATIADIQTNPDLMDNAIVTTAIVTQSGNSTASWTDAYIQDDSGYGVNLYASGDPDEGLVRGDEITVMGVVNEFNGITQIVDFAYVVNSSGNELPTPLVAATSDMAGNQDYEGTWVEVSGYIQNSVGTPSTTLLVDDGSGPVQVRVWAGTGIDLTAFSQWDHVTVHGVIDLFSDVVQIQPNMQEDIVASTPLPAPTNLAVVAGSGEFDIDLSWDTVDETNELFRYYGVYRNHELVGIVPTGGAYTDYPNDFGAFSYYVRAYYTVGVSNPTEAVDFELEHSLWQVSNLTSDIMGAVVNISWDWDYNFGEGVSEIAYDELNLVGSYIWPGNTMANKLTSDEPVKILALKYFTTIGTGDQQFNAEIYDWDSEADAPGTQVYTTGAQGSDMTWITVDVSDQDIIVNGDFVVGFGSIDATVAIAYEADVAEWDRGWNLISDVWTADPSGDRYAIRAIVQTHDGDVAEITPGRPFESTPVENSHRTVMDGWSGTSELDDFVEFKIIRDDVDHGTTSQLFFEETLEEVGEYTYGVAAVYDEGISEIAETTITYSSVEEGLNGIPEEFAIHSAYPNPFNPAVNVTLAIPEIGNVQVVVFDILGRKVATLYSGNLRPGYFRLSWQPQNLPSGMYFLKMDASNGFHEIRKLTFMK